MWYPGRKRIEALQSRLEAAEARLLSTYTMERQIEQMQKTLSSVKFTAENGLQRADIQGCLNSFSREIKSIDKSLSYERRYWSEVEKRIKALTTKVNELDKMVAQQRPPSGQPCPICHRKMPMTDAERMRAYRRRKAQKRGA